MCILNTMIYTYNKQKDDDDSIKLTAEDNVGMMTPSISIYHEDDTENSSSSPEMSDLIVSNHTHHVPVRRKIRHQTKP